MTLCKLSSCWLVMMRAASNVLLACVLIIVLCLTVEDSRLSMDMTSHMERVYCQDYRRLGMPVGGAIGPRHRVHRWRLSLVNSDYAVCKRYVSGIAPNRHVSIRVAVRHVFRCSLALRFYV